MEDKITLLNTWDTLGYADYLEWCKDNGIEPCSEYSEHYNNWVQTTLEMYWDDAIYEIEHSKLADRAFLITGSVGTWLGRITIMPQYVDGLLNALEKCYGTCDNVTAVVDLSKGTIEVVASHHDGHNCFTILLLNDKGKKLAEKCDDLGKKIVYNTTWWDKINNADEVF